MPDNKCVFCGKDCSFLATCDGCCIPCGDLMQQEGSLSLLKRIVCLGRAYRDVVTKYDAALETLKRNEGK